MENLTALMIASALILVLTQAGPLMAGPPKGAKWEPIPEFTDEFDGKKLDSSKWYDHNPTWQGRQPGYFSTKNVTVSGGKLHLTARAEDLPGLPEGYHSFTTAAVKSKTTVLYGYFEIKCRPMRSRASSSFWFYNDAKEEWTEIDVFELFAGVPGKEKSDYTNVHVFHSPTESTHWDRCFIWTAPSELADKYHVYAFEWDKDKLKWYYDGKVIREVENTHWHQPLYMNFDSETFGVPDKKDLPSTYSIEYIRSWRKLPDAEPAASSGG